MKKPANPAKAHYQVLRRLSWGELWGEEVARFDAATPEERREGVAVIRAVGAMVAEASAAIDRAAVRQWLHGLLGDPEEKVRRYAVAALPKLRGGEADEAALLTLWKRTEDAREKGYVEEALAKIAGESTLAELQGTPAPLRQRAEAAVARGEGGGIRLQSACEQGAPFTLQLECRVGLEGEVEQEAREAGFEVERQGEGFVLVRATRSFEWAALYRIRTFATAGVVLGTVGSDPVALAELIGSERVATMMKEWTDGRPRYRLEFSGRGHQRALVREVASRVYALRPEILNDPREALWLIDCVETGKGWRLTLRPRLRPDPRFAYRQQDVPAASHPPLAACMARWAGASRVVWDPFCGSGVELIECALRGGVERIVGTDLSGEAIEAARANAAAAGLTVAAEWHAIDFREYASVPTLGGGLDAIVTNPPMGQRVRIADLRGLMEQLLQTAERLLRPGGVLVFANPVRQAKVPAGLVCEWSQRIDMGGFSSRLERYVRRP